MFNVTEAISGIRRTWNRVLKGQCGIVSTKHLGPEFAALPSQVAGLVPINPQEDDGAWVAKDHVSSAVWSHAQPFDVEGTSLADPETV